eukprot:m.38075 g.38075  ORF g.38075 m.38075 type:complete len:500 (+) comp9386_c1_seq1:69-1568(+)
MYLLEAKKKAEVAEQQKQKEEQSKARMKKYAQKSTKVTSSAQSIKPKPSSTGQQEAKLALEKAEREKAQKKRQEEALRQKEQADLEEAMRRSKLEAQRQQVQQARAAQPRVAQHKVSVIRSAQRKGDMRIQSFHEPDEYDQHWKDMRIPCRYVGTFGVDPGKTQKDVIIAGMRSMNQYLAAARPAVIIICREGIKVIDQAKNKVAMAHALSRISMASADNQGTFFGFVAKNPKVVDKFCHVFSMERRRYAEDCQALVMKAFRLQYAAERTLPKDRKAAPEPQRRQWAKHNPLQGVSHVEAGVSSVAADVAHLSKAAQNAKPVPPRPAAASPEPPKPQPAKPDPPKPAPPRKHPVPASAPPEPEGVIDSSVDMSDVAWYQPGIPREIAMELLNMSDEGAFIVRDSSSQPGQLALTMKAQGLMHHYIIRRIPEGVVLGSEDQGQSPYPDLATLIIEYTERPGCLPCCLNLDATNVGTEGAADEEDDTFVDPDYESLKKLGL